MICTADGCAKPSRNKREGLCEAHYAKKRRALLRSLTPEERKARAIKNYRPYQRKKKKPTPMAISAQLLKQDWKRMCI